jgi:hypothetical protein
MRPNIQRLLWVISGRTPNGTRTSAFHPSMLQGRHRQYVCFQEMQRVGGATDMGAILPAKQHDERPLSGMAQLPLNDGLGSKADIQADQGLGRV